MPADIRVGIADDHPIFRRGLRQVIDAHDDMRVVAEAGDGVAAIEIIRQHQPDVAVLDIQMPGLTGFQVLQALGGGPRPTRLVFLTMHSEPAMFERAMAVGASGYVLKDAALSEVVQAVRVAAAGRTFVSPALSDYLLSRAYPRRGAASGADEPALAGLTDRERHILRLIADAQTSKEIADTLGVHYRTIENHRTAMAQKLGLQGSHALLKFAFAHKSRM